MLYFTLIPGNDVPDFLVQFSDLFLHWAIYLLNYSLFYLGLVKWNLQQRALPSMQWLLLFVSISLGGVLELIQEFYVEGRTGSMYDMAANTVGCLFGFLAFRWWKPKGDKAVLA